MALINWAISGTILASTSPLTDSSYPVANIINDDYMPLVGALEWQYTQGGNILSFPIYVVIDLGQEKPVSEVKLQGFDRQPLIGQIGGSTPKSYSILSAPDVGGTPTIPDFTLEWSGTLPPGSKIKLPAGFLSEGIAIISPEKLIRYIKVVINSIYNDIGTRLGISEVQIWGNASINTRVDITSDMQIAALTQITSDMYIFIPVFTDTVTILSDAEIDDNLKLILSDAQILGPGEQMPSNMVISNEEDQTILSDANIEQTLISSLNVFAAFPGSGSLGALEGEGYDPTLFAMHTLIFTDLISSSDETVVADIFTSTTMDMKGVEPPFGYQNYDWSYDWVATTYNSATYLVETRTGETLDELSVAVYFTRELGYRFRRGRIPRYHQWRLHVWASGSGDFEFHQFTVKGHVIQPISEFHRFLVNRPNTSISTIGTSYDVTSVPPPNLAAYTGTDILGDVTSDGLINIEDITALTAFISQGGTLTAQELINADTNQDGKVSITDLTKLIDYINRGGFLRRKPK